jgi:hypothetical protein
VHVARYDTIGGYLSARLIGPSEEALSAVMRTMEASGRFDEVTTCFLETHCPWEAAERDAYRREGRALREVSARLRG